MAIYTLKLLERREIARGTVQLIFDKPAGFTFKAGQYGGFTLINPTEKDAGGITRRFSLLSTPHDNHLAITTRFLSTNKHSAFKRMLIQLPIGSALKFAGPTGNFVLHDNVNVPAVLIAGGIGITPFYSMIKDKISHSSLLPIYLFYGNQSFEDAAYLKELTQIEKTNPHFTLIPTLVEPPTAWSGETGFITAQMIKKYIQDLSRSIYYVCGSPAMVTTLQEILAEMGINEDRIQIEDFPGY